MRFGKWQEINAQEVPHDRELYCSTTAAIEPKARISGYSSAVPVGLWEKKSVRLNYLFSWRDKGRPQPEQALEQA